MEQWVSTGNSHPVERIPEMDIETFSSILTGSSGTHRLALFSAEKLNIETILYAGLLDDRSRRINLLSARLPNGATFSSITQRLPAAHLFEREIHEQTGLMPQGHPWLKSVRRAEDSYPFYRIKGDEVHEVGVGPVHAGVIEPGHFRFNCTGERIETLEIMHGYQHRGVERKFLRGDIRSHAVLAETVSGDAAVAHAIAYAQLVEGITGTTVSPRAEALRAVMLELERAAMHIGDLGALSGDIAYISGADMFGAVRTLVINTSQYIGGNRFGRGMVRPGGVMYDITDAMIPVILNTIAKVIGDIDAIAAALFSNPVAINRFEGTGVVSRETADALGLTGPAARASGRNVDARRDQPSGLYLRQYPRVHVLDSGDVFARARIRYLEARESLLFVKGLLEQLPEGDLSTELGTVKPGVAAISIVEGWRGEVTHFIRTDENGAAAFYKIVDPSFFNWSALEMAVRGNGISDFPVCNKSFNLSYCGFDL